MRSAIPIGRTPALAPDEEFVAGVRPVEEAFGAHREAVRLLVVPSRRSALERLVLHATTLRIPIVEVEGGTLTAATGFDGHQGVALVARRRPSASIADVIGKALAGPEPGFILVLDSLEDPQNLGTLLRSGEAVGVHGVLLPSRHAAPMSPAAVKASAGAVEHLDVVILDDLPGALADLHTRGFRIVGSDADAPLTAREADLRGPIVIVVGSEGRGISPAVRRRCDLVVRIPMKGRVGSLNAAVAGSVLLYEASVQRSTAPRAESGADGSFAPGRTDVTKAGRRMHHVVDEPVEGAVPAAEHPLRDPPGDADDLLPGDPGGGGSPDPRA